MSERLDPANALMAQKEKDDAELLRSVRRLEVRHLRQLSAIGECGSIRAAAKRLSIAQPALSRSIHGVERDLGVRLIEPTTRGCKLTKYGEILLRYAAIIDANLRFAAGELSANRGAAAGVIRFGMGALEGLRLAPLIIQHMLKRYPSIQLSVVEGTLSTLHKHLLSGDTDFFIGPAPRDLPAGLAAEMVARVNLVVVARAQHPLARQDTVGYTDLAAASWILPLHESALANFLANDFLQHGFAPPSSPVRMASSSPALVNLILAGDFVALTSPTLIKHEVQLNRIKVLPFDTSAYASPVYIAMRELNPLPSIARETISEVRRICRDLKDL